MSGNDTIARGVIEVELDGSGVSSGVAQTEQTLDQFVESTKRKAKTASTAIEGIGEGGEKAAVKVDSQAKRLIQSIERATASMETGAKGSAAYYRAIANTRGVDGKLLKPYLDQLDAVTEKTRLAGEARDKMLEGQKFLADLGRTNDALGKTQSQLLALRAAELGVAESAAPMIAKLREAELATGSAGMSVKQYQAALRGLPAQMTDIFVSLQGGQRPLTVLLQQGGQLKDMFGGIGSAVRAAGGYIIGMINPVSLAATALLGLSASYYAGYKESQNLNNALLVTGRNAGMTAGQLSALAKEVGSINGEYGVARASLQSLLETGRFAGAQLEAAMRGVVAGVKVTGKDVASLVDEFVSLGEDPASAIAKLDQRYHFLTASTYSQIYALQEQGKAQDAATLAFNAFADAMENRRDGIKTNLSDFERITRGIKEQFTGLWDAIKNGGRDLSLEPLERQLEVAQQDMAWLAAKNPRAGSVGYQALANQALKIKNLGEEIAKTHQSAIAQAAEVEKEQAKIRSVKVRDDYLKERVGGGLSGSYARRLNEENEAFTKAIVGLEKNSAEYIELLAAHEKSVAEIKRSASSKTDGQAKRDQDELQRVVDSIRTRTTEYQQEAQAGQNATEAQKLRIKVEAELASTRNKQLAGSRAYIGSLLDENAAAEQAAQAVIKRAKLQTDLNALSERGAEALRGVSEQLSMEYQLYGKSNDAREIAAISIKEISAAETKLIELKKQHGELDAQIIAGIREEAAERGRATEAMQGQIRALGYARQLREENKKFGIELIFDDRARAKAQLEADSQMWQERIKLAGEGTRAQKDLQQEYATWYANQANKPAVDEWRRSVAQYDDIFRKGFAAMLNRGEGSWKSWTTSLKTTFKTTLADQIYKMFAQPFVVKIVASLLGIGGLGAQAGAMAGDVGAGLTAGAGGGAWGQVTGLLGNLKSVFTGGISGFNTSIVGGIQDLGVMLANGQGGLLDSIGGMLGQYASPIAYGLGFAPAVLSLIKGDIKGAAFSGVGAAIGSIFGPGGTGIGATLGSLVGSLFGGQSPKRYGSSANTSFSAGEVQSAGTGNVGRSLGVGSGLSSLNEAFSKSLGSLLAAFSLNDSINTSSNMVARTNVRGGFNAYFDGGDISWGEKFGKTKRVDLNAAFQQMIDSVMGEVLSGAIQKSKLPDGIRSLFDGMTDKTQVASMITASISLTKVQEQLADRFGVTVNEGAKAAKASGLVGDELVAFVNKLGTVAQGFKSPGEVILEAQAALQSAVGDVLEGVQLPSTLDAFDGLLKGLDKTTAEGIQNFSDLFQLRDGFAEFTKTLDGIKSGVKSAIFGLKSPSEQLADLRAEMLASFAEFDLEIPGSVSELIELGKSIDYTTEAGLTLAAAFPALVQQFGTVKNATDELIGSLKALDINQYRNGVDYARALAYQRNGISLDRLPSFDVGTNRVPRDMVAVVHADERIIPAADNRALIARLNQSGQSSADTVMALREVQATLNQNNQLFKENTRSMEAMVKLLRNVTSDGDAMRVETV